MFNISNNQMIIILAFFALCGFFTYTIGENDTDGGGDGEKTTLENISEGVSKGVDNYLHGDRTSVSAHSGESDEKDINYKISKPFADPYAELDKLIGLGPVKREVKSMINYIKVQQARKEKGLNTKDVSYHMVFYGNPGTGKTTVARIMASIFKDLGVLKKGHTVETDRSGLIAQYLGQTAIKTNAIVDAAMDGVLFIDEAYALMGGQQDYGHEAVATLLKRMEDDRDRVVVIIAGYTNEMNELLESNPGLKSRFNRYISFPDYTSDDLQKIFLSFAKDGGYELDAAAMQLLKQRMDKAVSTKARHFGNGRYARNVFERCIQEQANRLDAEGGAAKASKQELVTIKAAELKTAFDMVKE